MEAGHLEEADDYKMEGDILEMKNSMLIPIYARMKSIVKELKKSNISDLYEEYQFTEQLLREKIVK